MQTNFNPASTGLRSVNSTSTSNEENSRGIITAWRQWEAECPLGSDENRMEAINRLLSCWNRKNHSLYLCDLNLTTSPPLPPHITALDLSNNMLRRLPSDLPERLTYFNIWSNPLIEFESLDVPRQLYELVISNCPLIRELNDLPITLKRLSANHIPLSAQNVRLPDNLQEVRICGCGLTELPQIPSNLSMLVASENSLTYLSDVLPNRLEWVNLDGNRFTDIPAAVWALRRGTHVSLENNPFSEQVIQNLVARQRDASYQGPGIVFDMPEQSSSTPERNLSEIMAVFYPDDPNKADAIAAWSQFEKVPEAREFMKFLARLCDTVNSGKAEFKKYIGQLLADIINSGADELRALSFAVALEANASCQDRVTLTLMNMENVHIQFHISQGRYDKQLTSLVDLGRQMFRKEYLERIAHDKVTSLRAVDPIEVHLAYMVKLRGTLALTSAIEEIRFFDVAHVGQDDLAVATVMVKQRENAEFPTWLCTWGPWEAMLKRLDPVGYAAAKVDINAFNEHLKTMLQENQMVDNEDAKRALGATLLKQMTVENQLPLTEKILANEKSLPLSKRWPVTD